MSDKVAVFDTTLRDGEQAAGTRLGSREKLIVARQLALLNVDVIEAGYPNSSPEDFEAVQRIGREVAGPAISAVTLARQFTDDVEFYAEDAGRAEPDYLLEMIGAVIASGAGVVNIPDTTGYTVPEQYGSLIRRIREKVPGIERAAIDRKT